MTGKSGISDAVFFISVQWISSPSPNLKLFVISYPRVTITASRVQSTIAVGKRSQEARRAWRVPNTTIRPFHELYGRLPTQRATRD